MTTVVSLSLVLASLSNVSFLHGIVQLNSAFELTGTRSTCMVKSSETTMHDDDTIWGHISQSTIKHSTKPYYHCYCTCAHIVRMLWYGNSNGMYLLLMIIKYAQHQLRSMEYGVWSKLEYSTKLRWNIISYIQWVSVSKPSVNLLLLKRLKL